MSSEDFELPFQKKIVAAVDFVDFVTQGARATTTTSDTSVSNTTISHLTTTLTGVYDKPNNFNIRNPTPRIKISTCIKILLP
jgi:hypothetical protein